MAEQELLGYQGHRAQELAVLELQGFLDLPEILDPQGPPVQLDPLDLQDPKALQDHLDLAQVSGMLVAFTITNVA